jgi:hypothetical protein
MIRTTTIDKNGFPCNECASRGCNKQGMHYLRVPFLNKVGCFCEMCRINLLRDNLVEEPTDEND